MARCGVVGSRGVRVRTFAAVAVMALLTACGGGTGGDVDPAQVDSVEPPATGACRVLTPDDAEQPSNASRVVDCADRHTAETFAVGQLPEELKDSAYDAQELVAYAYQTCSAEFEEFLGGDESTVMRAVVSWVWFRPSKKAWDKGARWYRCDVVGGGAQSTSYVALPTTAAGL